MPALNSRVWRRYGQLRIYVSAGDQAVGWFEPLSGRSQLSQRRRRTGLCPTRTGMTFRAMSLARRPAPGPGNCAASILC